MQRICAGRYVSQGSVLAATILTACLKTRLEPTNSGSMAPFRLVCLCHAYDVHSSSTYSVFVAVKSCVLSMRWLHKFIARFSLLFAFECYYY